MERGGAYTFGSGKGSRTGSGRSFARIALSVRMRGEKGYLSLSMMSCSFWEFALPQIFFQSRRSAPHVAGL
jgi:hypothetical protein